jgi:hypothetical protein
MGETMGYYMKPDQNMRIVYRGAQKGHPEILLSWLDILKSVILFFA